jgi:hypothetical protein
MERKQVMHEFNVFKCPICNRYDTQGVNDNYMKCHLCGLMWDRVYQDEKGFHIHKNSKTTLQLSEEQLL